MPKRSREEYERGLPGYHDPMAGVGGAPYARSALTLRLWLAGFGLVFCAGAAVALFLLVPGLAWFAWVLVVLAVIAAVDFAWVAHRKQRGEPG
ncbi:hypothetical protein SAMN02982929_01544 [Saccharopolyspora kobensis]|uniref:Uncharacterized protein n=1 Tax=Saccharopolyspora kobensis TaxID=146035 RepID=A0A1H5XK86_9PSEU|nr:DUF6343 family protein [Saccharopolyspora kobensis]SEG11820.1 hypothetical protein SAMN02982929_01544 [Saccharopolyspora kobensis]SFE41920.1 hypothetical protein SAMN05216506_11180 [Saccharopolyspora kobensis]